MSSSGSPWANGSAGYTYVVFGKTATWGWRGNVVLNTGAELIDGTQGSRLDGVTSGDSAGYVVATGDINGDGVKDVIIGAHTARNSHTGSVYIYNGRASGWPNPNYSLGGL